MSEQTVWWEATDLREEDPALCGYFLRLGLTECTHETSECSCKTIAFLRLLRRNKATIRIQYVDENTLLGESSRELILKALAIVVSPFQLPSLPPIGE
jgi:hypothetical protein